MQHIDPKGKVGRYFNDPAGDRLRTEAKQVQARKVVGGDDDLTTWTREGAYQGVHYVFDRAGDLVRKGASHGDAPDDLTLIWDANHRLAESRRNGQSTYNGYDPLGRRVFKRNPTQTTWFFWDNFRIVGELVTDSVSPVVLSSPAESVLSLTQYRRWGRLLHEVFDRAVEFVFYPDTFIPLALISWDAKALSSDEKKARIPEVRSTIPTAPLGRLDVGTSLGGTVAPTDASSARRGMLGEIMLGAGASLTSREPVTQHVSANASAEPPVRHDIQSAAILQEEGDAQNAGQGRPERSLVLLHADPNGVVFRALDGLGDLIIEMPALRSFPHQGQYMDVETGLAYNVHRYFDPDIEGYIGQDPIGLSGGVNPYAYGLNVLGWVDPLGLSSTCQLTKNLNAAGRPLLPGQTAHHIVQQNNPSKYAVLSRDLLVRNGLDVEIAENGARLWGAAGSQVAQAGHPGRAAARSAGTYHAGKHIHSPINDKMVYRMLRSAEKRGGADAIRAALSELGRRQESGSWKDTFKACRG